MSQPVIKFIAADMDGTLLDEQSNLDPQFFGIFRALKQNNVMFAAASGRQYYSLVETFAPLKDEMFFIAENGTLVMHQGEELYSCTIDRESIKSIIETTRTIQDAHIVLCGKNSAYIETNLPYALKEIGKYYHRCQYVEDLLTVEDEFIKVAICHFDGTEQHVFPLINDEFGLQNQVVISAKIWLDVMNQQASKGAAIKHLQKSLGFSFEETMSFGDYLNDLEMLQESYHSYAMENAHPQVKQLARFSAPSNKEAGVFKVINHYLASLK